MRAVDSEAGEEVSLLGLLAESTLNRLPGAFLEEQGGRSFEDCRVIMNSAFYYFAGPKRKKVTNNG